jgi:small subunit ribosomal protein S4
MARYTGADCKLCRREKTKLFLKGAKCDSPKCPIEIRAGFAKSRDMARQLVRHGHILVNGRRVDIPSYRVSESDIVEVATKSQEMTPFIVARAEAGERQVPAWLEVVPDKMRVLVHSLPVRAQIDTQVQEQLIVEFYSK